MSAAPTKQALRRLAGDVRALMGDSLAEHGIFYRHSQTNVLHGQAVIVGAPDTLYAGGGYVFDFVFPPDYPHRPPAAKFRTVDSRDRTRFNPNTYRNGKVCLSVLNTWQGDQWTGCQTISSVLLAIKANVFGVDEPLLNEPGVGGSHPDFVTYHDIVRFKNLQVAVWQTAVEVAGGEGSIWPCLRPVVARAFVRGGHEQLLKALTTRAQESAPRIAQTSIYEMTVPIDYQRLLTEVGERGPALRAKLEQMGSAAEIDV